MSLLHLLGVDNDLQFDGKGLDKTIDNIKGYAKSSFTEDEIDDANSTLEDILSSAESIDSLEKISDNVAELESTTTELVYSNLSVYKILKRISSIASEYCDVDNKQHIQDVLLTIAEEAEDGIAELNCYFPFEMSVTGLFGLTSMSKYCNFKFVPDVVLFSGSDKSGEVTYVSGDWTFVISTYIGYGGLKKTPKSIQYKHLDFCKACDKAFELGINPENVSDEDYSLLMMLDEHNKIIYDMFKDNRKDK